MMLKLEKGARVSLSVLHCNVQSGEDSRYHERGASALIR